MQQQKTGLSRFQYALTGGAMLILAVVAIGLAYTTPWGQALARDSDGNEVSAYYGVTHVDVEAGETEETVSYRDQDLDGAPGITEFRTGFWLTPIAAVVLFGAAMSMFAAPSSSLAAARGGAIAGILGALVLLAAIAAFGLGFSDHKAELEELAGDDAETGTTILGGGVLLGAAAVLSLGGSVLGFSDKPAPAPAPSRPAGRTCGQCDATVPAGQAFCGSCGASVS